MTVPLEIETPIDIEDVRGDEPDFIPQYRINSYGADFTVDGLVKRLQNQDILIPAFQRQYVWDMVRASQLIESFLLGLPVPGIFLSREAKTQQLIVIDGQQRLLTLRYFYDEKFGERSGNLSGKRFELQLAQKSDFYHLTYSQLKPSDRRRLDDSILHATIVQQEDPAEVPDSSIYHIFHRLNAAGVPLTDQEIRAAIYHGAFNTLLAKLNMNSDWRALYGSSDPDQRMGDQELILRFFAFYYRVAQYEPRMNEFLNTFMQNNRTLEHYSEVELTQIFENTLNVIERALGVRAFKPGERGRLNAAVLDSVTVGVAYRLKNGMLTDDHTLKIRYAELMKNDEYIKATAQGNTASKLHVQTRIQLAIAAFVDVA